MRTIATGTALAVAREVARGLSDRAIVEALKGGEHRVSRTTVAKVRRELADGDPDVVRVQRDAVCPVPEPARYRVGRRRITHRELMEGLARRSVVDAVRAGFDPRDIVRMLCRWRGLVSRGNQARWRRHRGALREWLGRAVWRWCRRGVR